jgi:dihydropteroate synthase
MACEICGRNSCMRSFHALEEQGAFDDAADGVKERMKQILKRKIERLKDYGVDENRVLVDVNDVIDVIDSYS